MKNTHAFLLFLLLAVGMSAIAPLRAEDPAQPTTTVPATSELDKLTDLVSQFVGVSLQYSPEKVRGNVRLAVQGEVTQAALWEIYNQVLVSQGFTTVLTGLPPVYQVVPLNEASQVSATLAEDEIAKLPYKPGFAVVIRALKHISAETAIKALGSLIANQTAQVRTYGFDDRKLVISAARAKLQEIEQFLAQFDQPGMTPTVRTFRPKRTSPAALQTAVASTWSALGRIAGRATPIELQVSADGTQLVMIASATDLDQLQKMVDDLDQAEPVETRTYRPRFFSAEEVGLLLDQLFTSHQRDAAPNIVRDKLTSSLIITATAAQHRRIEDLVRTLDDAPPTTRRQVRTFQIKHRPAEDLALVLTGLIDSGITDMPDGEQPAPGELAPAAAPIPPPSGSPTPFPDRSRALPARTSRQPVAGAALISGGSGTPVMLTTDLFTNSIIALGDPKTIDQIETLIKQLDQRQPQVDIEVLLVSVSSSQGLELGVEMMALIQQGSVSGSIGSFFGLSTQSGPDPATRLLSSSVTGLGGVVINQGDWAGVVKALETISDGRSLIRSHVVVNNNAKATIDGVVQQPVTSSNIGVSVSTTSVTGTTDAGTQISISPQISTADYITLTYAISQSSFLGQPVLSNGALIPPAKRQDSVASVATIPDGFVIALGGLSNRNIDQGESRIPFLGGIPFIGNLFKTQSNNQSDSRFYVFIRASVLRNPTFGDLRNFTEQEITASDLEDEATPKLKPQLLR